MTRRIVMLIVMAFALGFVGCRSCMAPFDHCQPTFLPERGDQCMGELFRCGSVLGGADRASNANGYCESCGGGEVEYYSSNSTEGAYEMEETAVASAETPEFAPQAAPTPRIAQASASRGSESWRRAPYASADFALNDDSGDDSY